MSFALAFVNQKHLAGSNLRHAVVFELDVCKSCRSGVPPFEGIGGDSVALLGLERRARTLGLAGWWFSGGGVVERRGLVREDR